jgi:hypothetical protein
MATEGMGPTSDRESQNSTVTFRSLSQTTPGISPSQHPVDDLEVVCPINSQLRLTQQHSGEFKSHVTMVGSAVSNRGTTLLPTKSPNQFLLLKSAVMESVRFD